MGSIPTTGNRKESEYVGRRNANLTNPVYTRTYTRGRCGVYLGRAATVCRDETSTIRNGECNVIWECQSCGDCFDSNSGKPEEYCSKCGREHSRYLQDKLDEADVMWSLLEQETRASTYGMQIRQRYTAVVVRPRGRKRRGGLSANGHPTWPKNLWDGGAA